MALAYTCVYGCHMCLYINISGACRCLHDHIIYVDNSIQTSTDSGWESTVEGEPEVAESEGEVLVEEVAEELAHPDVRPPAVDQ